MNLPNPYRNDSNEGAAAMNTADFSKIGSLSATEATLRLIATLPAPEGLAERVQLRLDAEPRTARVLSWPAALRPGAHGSGTGWLRGNAMRTAAAAAIVFAVAGGGWGIYSRVQPASSARIIAMPPRGNAPGAFSNAGAIRTPQTANGPVLAKPIIASPVIVKPNAKNLAKPTTPLAK
jgi:hypothetical protein